MGTGSSSLFKTTQIIISIEIRKVTKYIANRLTAVLIYSDLWRKVEGLGPMKPWQPSQT